jgi:pyruvate kinase
MGPEKVPMVQKRIIELSNRAGKPVITATQMLESMIKEARPTRAEVSDVANAIMDGTDAVMLSGETAMGVNPTRAVEMMARIALDVEEQASFRAYPPAGRTEAHALAKAIAQMHTILECPLVVVRTRTGLSARLIAAERLDCPVMAFTDEKYVFHTLNLLWGIRPTYLADSLDLWQFVRFADIAPAKSRVIVADCDDRFDAPQATMLSIKVAD